MIKAGEHILWITGFETNKKINEEKWIEIIKRKKNKSGIYLYKIKNLKKNIKNVIKFIWTNCNIVQCIITIITMSKWERI